MTLNKKAFFAISAVLFVLLVLFAFFRFSVDNRHRLHEQNREYLADATLQLAENVDAAIHGGFDNIRIVSNLVSQGLTSPEIDLVKLRTIMEESIFDFVEFADTAGNDHIVLGTITDARDRQYYLKGVKEGKVGLEIIYNSRATHETLLMFYAPVYFEKRIVGSVIGVYQAAKKMSKMLSVSFFDKPTAAFLATESGRVVASGLKLDPSKELYVWDSHPALSDFAGEIKASVTAGKNWATPSDFRNGCVYMAKLPKSNWYLMQYFPKRALEKMVDDAEILGFRLLIFLLIVYAILLVIILNFARIRHKQDVENRLILENALNQAESANRAKTTFLNSMSHDIRTPMNAVIGYAALARKHIGDQNLVLDYLKKIGVSSAHLLSLINDVLDMSRIESGKLSLNEGPENLMDIIRAVESIVQADVQAKHLSFKVEFENVVHENVLCDRLRLSQVLLNILSNSVKYTSEDGSVSMIVAEKKSDKEKCSFAFTIKDSGFGMTEDFLKVVFEPFTRMDSSTISGIQGTGLGMTITKSIVDMMGGTIGVESKVGLGTQITINVDFKIFNAVHGATTSLTQESKSPKENVGLKGKKILLVEDNEMNREIATDLLQEAGFVIDSAGNGAEAVEKVKNADAGGYDLILMDVQMPVMDGYEATRKIRALESDLRNIPIVAMTANVFEEDRKMAMDAGMNDHTSKPIDVDILKATIARLLI